jgi:hypothetical protein
MSRRIAALTVLAVVLAASAAVAKTHTIENKFLIVAYDDQSQTFSAKDKASGREFLTHGTLEGDSHGTPSIYVGDGIRILAVPDNDKSSQGLTTLLLTEESPFLFVSGQFALSDAPREIKKIVPAVFSLDLGKPTGELRTLGTAGLTAPDKNPGSYLFLALADPKTRHGVVAGWLTHELGDGVVFSSVKQGRVEFTAQIEYGRLLLPAHQPGSTPAAVKRETLVIGYFDDARLGLEQFADTIAKHYKIKLRPQINGYCTWYAEKPYGKAGDEKSIVQLAEFAARELKPFGFSLVQIDDQWQDGGIYNGPRRGFDRARPDGPYPHGMKPVAERFKELGLAPGIWFIPFARNHQDPEYKDRQDWFVRRANGKPLDTKWGGTALDLTHPAVKEHLVQLVKTIRGWGYTYFKMDSLGTGPAVRQQYVNDGYKDDHMGENAPFHDPTKTNIEMYRDALKLLREAAGPDVLFSGCNVNQNMRCLGASIGLVDSMRIGPDNGHKWGDYKKEIAKSGCGSIVTGPIRGSRLYFLNGRVWWNDPDPSYVRAAIPLSHARLIASWVAVSGQFNLNSDWIPGLPNERLDIISRVTPSHGATARPVDYFDSILPSIWLVTDTRGIVRRDVLGLFNWDKTERTIECAADWAGLDPKKTYDAFDFWDNKPLLSFDGSRQIRYDVPGQSCRVIALRATEGYPVLVSTSRHVTQGMVDVTGETWNAAARELSATSQVVGGDAYELRVAGMDALVWSKVSVSEADQAAGVTIVAKPESREEGGWVRATITSGQSRSVRWTIHFERRKAL